PTTDLSVSLFSLPKLPFRRHFSSPEQIGHPWLLNAMSPKKLHSATAYSRPTPPPLSPPLFSDPDSDASSLSSSSARTPVTRPALPIPALNKLTDRVQEAMASIAASKEADIQAARLRQVGDRLDQLKNNNGFLHDLLRFASVSWLELQVAKEFPADPPLSRCISIRSIYVTYSSCTMVNLTNTTTQPNKLKNYYVCIPQTLLLARIFEHCCFDQGRCSVASLLYSCRTR
ncbi:DNA-binding enhancer protein-related, partial [Striga asiatica]